MATPSILTGRAAFAKVRRRAMSAGCVRDVRRGQAACAVGTAQRAKDSAESRHCAEGSGTTSGQWDTEGSGTHASPPHCAEGER